MQYNNCRCNYDAISSLVPKVEDVYYDEDFPKAHLSKSNPVHPEEPVPDLQTGLETGLSGSDMPVAVLLTVAQGATKCIGSLTHQEQHLWPFKAVGCSCVCIFLPM